MRSRRAFDIDAFLNSTSRKRYRPTSSSSSGTVAPAIPDGATVIIHGHTDVIGDPEYNVKLSRERSDATQSILARELTKAGKTVTFDTYGFGEDERRAPFNNTLPEQRYYNRTVVIEVVPHR